MVNLKNMPCPNGFLRIYNLMEDIMSKIIKALIYFSIFVFFTSLSPNVTLAYDQDVDQENVVLLSSENDDDIVVYEDEELTTEIARLSNDTTVILLEERGDISLIRYNNDDLEQESLKGFVQTNFIVNIDETEAIKESPILPESNQEGVLNEKDTIVEEEIQESNNQTNSENHANSENHDVDEKQAIPNQEPFEDDGNKAVEMEITNERENVVTENITLSTFSVESVVEERLRGVALKDKTSVYADTSQSSQILKSYNQGHILIFQSYNSEWYSATVYLNGQPHTGYIHSSDVDVIQERQPLQGYALQQPTHVYASPTRNSGSLKSYNVGHSLKYQSFSSQWHQATVYVNGRPHTGYIHASDVGEQKNSNVRLKGIALTNVSVYSERSKSSKSLKTYQEGSILIYRPYDTNWYSATVYLNGIAHAGYIHVNDVETAVTESDRLRGFALLAPTKIYASANTNSRVLKSYKQGHVLQYRTFTKNWYEATVYINGKATTGYLHANHVEELVEQQSSMTGAAGKSPTNVYALPGKNATVLKSYSFSSRLIYRTYSENWYEATVYVSGKAHTGYIHRQDVIHFSNKSIVLDPGHGGRDPGALGLGIVEKELNMDIAKRVQRLLENVGARVIMTRSNDVFIELAERAKIANEANADIFVSIHGNSFTGLATGVETFWYGKYEKEYSMRLAQALQNRVVASLQLSNRRVAEGNFHVIRETKIPSALVEVGFIDNPYDAGKLRQSRYRQLAAEGIFYGVLDYFN